MIPIALPIEERRTVLRSFWLVLSILFGLFLSVVGLFLQVPLAVPFGFVGALASASIVFARPQFVLRAYRAWDRLLVRPFAELATRAITGICYFIILAATGRAGSRLRQEGQDGTTWETKTHLDRDARPLPFAAPEMSTASGGWLLNYLQWSMQSRNFWSVSLIPFLCLLKIVSTTDRKKVQANIYTLF